MEKTEQEAANEWMKTFNQDEWLKMLHKYVLQLNRVNPVEHILYIFRKEIVEPWFKKNIDSRNHIIPTWPERMWHAYFRDVIQKGFSEDKLHLQWLYDRLIEVHGENPNVDYMLKFEEIINKMN